MTLKAATLFCYIEPSNSAKIKAPPFRQRMITMGPKYLGFIFLSADNSMAEFLTKTRLPSFRLNSFILCCMSLSSWSVLLIFSFEIFCLISSTCSMYFAKAQARSPINSVLETILSGYFTSHVASMISSGIAGCTPVIIKYGEHLVPFLTVILSTHVT